MVGPGTLCAIVTDGCLQCPFSWVGWKPEYHYRRWEVFWTDGFQVRFSRCSGCGTPWIEEETNPDDVIAEEVFGVDIGDDTSQQVDALVPAGAVLFGPDRDDKITVNGTTLMAESALATLRAACNYYGISQSGGKTRCFSRLWQHQKKLEWEVVMEAAQQAATIDQRVRMAASVAHSLIQTGQGTRKSTSSGAHFLNGSFIFGSSRGKRTVSLPPCEAELHAIVGTMSDAIFIWHCLQCILGSTIEHFHFTNSSSDRKLLCRQGCGKVRHLATKILWAQEKTRLGEVIMRPIAIAFNCNDIGTKPLSKKRLLALMAGLNMVYVDSGETVGLDEYEALRANVLGSRKISKLAKAIFRLSLITGLVPVATGQQCLVEPETSSGETFWMWICISVLMLAWLIFFGFAYAFWRKLDYKL